MKRLTYKKNPVGLMISQIFATETGKNVRVDLSQESFEIRDMQDGTVLKAGESKNPMYLKNLAKKALVSLVGVNLFEVETRNRD